MPVEAVAPCAKLTDEEELYWLALRLVPGLGAVKTARLIEEFRSPQAIFRASQSEIEAREISGSVARSIVSGCVFEDALEQREKLKAHNAQLIPYGFPLYPSRLMEIYDPPPLLFVSGNAKLLDSVMIAMVGTRRPTPYGMAATEKLSADLAHAGATIVSGMARGVDTAAHRAALRMGGNTVAVYGCGLDHVYPAENRKLAAEIAEKGLILSEFPIGVPAHPQNFPVRNRIVSGMSNGVVIVEGAQYSGSTITARLAAEQGREVYAVPGNITSKMSWAPNLLIKQGAKLVQDAEDILSDLSSPHRLRLLDHMRPDSGQQDTSKSMMQLDLQLGPNAPVARRLLSALKIEEGTRMDSLLESNEAGSPSEVIAALFELEMLGMVRQLPGKQFVRVW